MNIRDVMTPNPRTVSPQDSIQNAARIMRDEDTGVVPVVDNGRAVGVVTDRDIVVRAVADGELNRPVRDIVSGDVVTARPDMSTREAAQLMSEHQVRRLPVVENERLVGIVSLGDLAVKDSDDRAGNALEEISQGVKERER
jgi:CBS domain-containing protein